MIDIERLRSSKLISTPFKYSKIDNILSVNLAEKLLETLPLEGNYRSIRKNGSDKIYNVVNNIRVSRYAHEKFRPSYPRNLFASRNYY